MPKIDSNPYHDTPPTLEQDYYSQPSEWGLKIRETLLSAIFFHPKKTFLLITLIFLSSIMLCAAPWLLALPLAAAISMTVVGGLTALVTSLFLIVNTHAFGYPDTDPSPDYTSCERTEIYHEGELMGHVTLEYKGDDGSKKMPYLTIEAENNYKCGYVQGKQLAPQANEILTKLKRIYGIVSLGRVLGYQIPEWGSDTMVDRFKQSIPPRLMEEMNGMVLGHNNWAAANQQPQINLNEVIMMHMLPDVHNIKGLDLTTELLSSGCTAGLARLDDGHVMHFRNTDWASYNEASAKTLFVERRIDQQRTTRNISFPLLVGTVYGENEDGLTLSINVSPGGTVYNNKGMLACVLYRELLDNCASTETVKARIEQEDSQPIGPCQLTVSDDKDGCIVRFYQTAIPKAESAAEAPRAWDNDNAYVFRHDISNLDAEHPLLVVANDGLKKNEQGELQRGNHHDSYQRIHNVMKGMQSDEPLSLENCVTKATACLALPLVNNHESVHTIIHVSQSDKDTYVATDNGYSARLQPARIHALGAAKVRLFAAQHPVPEAVQQPAAASPAVLPG